MKRLRAVSCVFLFLCVLWESGVDPLATTTFTAPVTLSGLDVPYTQNFNTLASASSSTFLPPGWGLDETGGSFAVNGQYTVGDGSSIAGDVYSFGTIGSSDRAFGTLLTHLLSPMIGAAFTNGTGSTIRGLDIAYIGEQWRAGVTNRGVADRLDFQFSVDATSLTNGTWTDADALDLLSTNISTTAGALDGNAAINRHGIAGTISGLNLAPGATIRIRWKDVALTSADNDDGLAIDEFTLTPRGGVTTPPSATGAASPASINTGDATLLTVTVTPGTNPSSTGLTVLGDLTGIGGSSIQPFYDDGTSGDVMAGDHVFSFATTVAPTASSGVASLPVSISDAESRTATATISLTVIRPATPIHDIQGNGAVSPLTGASDITTEGIITGVKSNGFFIQASPADYDLDPNTSEGIFVFTTSAGLPATAAVGNRVRVSGTINEFGVTGDPAGVSSTEITSPAITVLATGQPLPPAVTLTAADLFPGASFLQLEKYEGMRVHLDTVVSVTPTGGIVSEANATSTSSGLFFAVLPGTARPFREPGIQAPLPVPPDAPATATPPVFDGNYEHIGVDSYSSFLNAMDAKVTAPPAGSTLEVTTGVTVNNVTGPLDFASRLYIVDAERWNPPAAATANISAAAVSDRRDGEFSVATFNLERFFDTANDSGVSDVVLNAAAFDGRLRKASLAIRNVLRMPDIIGVEEVENLPTLQAIADRVNGDAATAGQESPQYQAFLMEGQDVGGIDSGLLVRADRINLQPGQFTVTQYGGAGTTYVEPDGSTALLNDRPPLVLDATVSNGGYEPYPITVIVNHLRSLSGIDGSDGARVRAKRRAQADYLAQLSRTFQAAGKHVISVGDYNAFDVNDGYVDVVGIVRGIPAPASEVTLTTMVPAELPAPPLFDAIALAPADQRYSFVFDGNAQELDHVLVTPDLRINRIEYGRMNADFPESDRGDVTRPERLSDHDPIVAFFNLPDVDTTAPLLTLPGSITVEGNTFGGADVTFAVSARDGVDGDVTPVCDHASDSLFTVGTTMVSCTATDAHGNTSAGSFAVTVTDSRAPAVNATSVSPGSIWPPNGQMVRVTVLVTASDTVSATSSRIVGITGNDGATSGDSQIAGALTALVRASRSGGGAGRTYMLTIETTDTAGNVSMSTATVFVPHDQRK